MPTVRRVHVPGAAGQAGRAKHGLDQAGFAPRALASEIRRLTGA